MDCLIGPFVVKRARSEVKRYACIFTCFTTRAIHLELLEDLSANSFINALRRFMARRAPVKKLYCDNGTHFVGAKNELSKWATSQSIGWSFNPPSASHMGGVWERMIRTVRKVLLAIMPTHALMTDDSFGLCFVKQSPYGQFEASHQSQ